MSSKVLVTGAGGFVGTHLVNELHNQGYEITATSLNMPWYLRKQNSLKISFIPLDLKNGNNLESLVENKDVVYHLGAVFNFSAPRELLEVVNIRGTEKLAKACAKAGVKKFIYFSSGAIYGPGEDETPVDEKKQPRPADNYAWSKWEGEQKAFEQNGVNGMQVISLRPGAIYGPYSVYGDALAMWLLKKGLMVGIPGFGRIVSSHVHVKDCVKSAIHLADLSLTGSINASTPHEVAYNICDDTPTPNAELLKAAAKLIRHKGLIGFFSFLRLPTPLLKFAALLAEGFAKITNSKPLFDRVSIDYITTQRSLDNRKLKKTGYQLLYPRIFDALEETIRWYEETGWRTFRIERYYWN